MLIDVLNNPELFSATFLKILNKDSRLIPFKWNSVQRDFHNKRTGKDIILKARQLGMSTYIQGEIFRRLITKSTRALTLTHSDKTTLILRDTADRFYKYFPLVVEDEDSSLHKKPNRKYANANVSTFTDYDSSHYIGTAGNTEIGRGGSYTDIHLSETAFFPDAEKIIAGAMQGGNPNIILESTANGAQGYFYELCMESIAKRNEWTLHFYPWYTNPEYQIVNDQKILLTAEEQEVAQRYGLTESQIKWRRSKQIELKRYFHQEYPENPLEAFLVSSTGFFSDIDQDFYKAPRNVTPIPGHRYSGGIDWGQSNDFTCMIVVDRTSRQMVDYLHLRKMSWNLQRQEIRKMYSKWGLSGLKAEINSIGNVNVEELEKDAVSIERFTTTNQSKSSIFQRLHEELETGLQLQDWEVLRSEMNTLVSKQTKTGLWTIEADGTAHDDTCIALALAITAKLEKPQIRYY